MRLEDHFSPEASETIRLEIERMLAASNRERELLTIPEFAAETGRSVKAIRNLVDRGRIQTCRHGSRVLIPRFEAGR